MQAARLKVILDSECMCIPLIFTLTRRTQINVAYGILINPAKRAQYDRDRLEYLYTHFATHTEFPAAAITEHETTRDEQIQVYATDLVGRVRDPIEHKKTAILARIARTRTDLDDFNERSDRIRQDWATSPNQVLRMASNVLREVVVCAEGDVCMLEDELGRLEGILAPRDQDGPAGRITSGQYGSEMGAPPGVISGKHTLIAHQRVPSLPRSPTMPVQPKSASKLGIPGEDSSGRGDDSSDGPSPALAEATIGDRVNSFVLGPTAGLAMHVQPVDLAAKATQPFLQAIEVPTLPTKDNKMIPTRTLVSIDPCKIGTLKLPGVPSTVVTQLTPATDDRETDKKSDHPSPSTLHNPVEPAGTGMGLIEWQRLHGACAVSTSVDNDTFWASLNFQPVTIDPSPASSATKTNPFADPHALDNNSNNNNTVAADATTVEPMFRRPNRQGAERALHPTLLKKTSDEEAPAAASSSSGGGDIQHFGFHVAPPVGRANSHPAVGTGAANSLSLAPGAGPLPSVARSAGIKDFQVRVWTAANAARAGTGNGNGNGNGSGTTDPAIGTEGEGEVGGDGNGDGNGGRDEQQTRYMLSDEVKRLQESICMVQPPRVNGGERSKGREEEQAAVKSTGPESGAKTAAVALAPAPAASSSSAAAAATAGAGVGGGGGEKDVFRRSKMGTVGRRTPMELDDPFV